MVEEKYENFYPIPIHRRELVENGLKNSFSLNTIFLTFSTDHTSKRVEFAEKIEFCIETGRVFQYFLNEP